MSQLPQGIRTLRLIEAAWADPAFKASLHADPAAALKKQGFAVPAGATIKVLDNDVDHIHYVIAAPGVELIDEHMKSGKVKAPPISKEMQATAERSQRIRSQAQSDPVFKKSLLANPVATLRREGVPIPDGVRVTVVENTSKLIHLVLPLPPAPAELSEEQLEAVVGGASSRGTPLGIIGLDNAT